jgi:hypothetical protein
MKKLLLIATAAACALAAQAQTETTGRPGVVVNSATATPALIADMAQRGMTVSFARMTQSLDGHLEAAIAGSRKFTVLERKELGQVLDDPTRLGDALRLRVNDYCVIMRLDSFVDSTERLPMDGKVMVKHRYQLSGQVKIVGGETAEVLDMSNLQIEDVEFLQTDNAVQSKDKEARLDDMMPKLARRFAEESFERLMGVAFPMKAIDVDDDVITINRGEDFLSKGDIVEIFGKSRVIEDEDTGEEIKIKGKLLGKAKITSTEPNYSQAQAVGKFDVPTGAEVRKVQE